MNLFGHFMRGHARVLHRRGVVFVLYFAALVFSLAATGPFRVLLSEVAGTAVASDFHTGLFLDALMDYIAVHGDSLLTALLIFPSILLLYGLLSPFLTAGLIGTHVRESKFVFSRFMQLGGLYYGKFLKVLFVAILALLPIVLGAVALIPVLGALSAGWDPAQQHLLGLAAALLLLCALALWNMVYDYARISIVVDEPGSAIAAFVRGTRFTFSEFSRAAGLYLLNLAPLLLFVGLYLVISGRLETATLRQIYALFVVQQILIIVRVWIRAAFFGSLAHFYQYPERKSPGVQDLFARPAGRR